LVLAGERRTDVPLLVLQRIGKAVKIRHGLATVTGLTGKPVKMLCPHGPRPGVPATDPMMDREGVW